MKEMQPILQNRREGFALAATIMAMLVVGLILTGGFYAASQESVISKSNKFADDALYLAETGLNAVNTTASNFSGLALVNGRLAVGPTTVTVNGRTLGTYTDTVYRLGTYLYFIKSTGTVSQGGLYAGASHTVGRVVRIKTTNMDSKTAVTVYGNLMIFGTSDIVGTDTYPSDWSGSGCTTNTSNTAVTGNQSPRSSVIDVGDGAITGTVTRKNLTSNDFFVYGDYTYDQLAAIAEKTYAAGVTINPGPVYDASGACDKTQLDNWGMYTPNTDPCYNYFPLIHAQGDLHITSANAGQGILLVDGNLEISGGFTFYGVVVVKGDMTMTGAGGHVNGTISVYGNASGGSQSQTYGASLLQYSSCAISRAVLNNETLTRLSPIYNRSYIDITAVQGGS